jgi:hypothetical protein
MLGFSPMHHEKYVLVVILAQLRRTDLGTASSYGSVWIAGNNFVRKDASMHREF